MSKRTDDLAEAHAWMLELQVEAAKARIGADLAQAELRATEAEVKAIYLERRVEELEYALARRQRRKQDARRGIERLR